MESRAALIPLGAVMVLLLGTWYAIAMPIYYGDSYRSSVVAPAASSAVVLEAR